jgi:hypothetical protein
MLLTEKNVERKGKVQKMEGFIQNQSKKARHERQSGNNNQPRKAGYPQGTPFGAKIIFLFSAFFTINSGHVNSN